MRCIAIANDSKEEFMTTTRKQSFDTKRLALLGLLTALVAILAYLGGFIKISGLASISLTLIPVVLGAALLGPVAGAWLGGVAGAVFFMTADAVFWLGLSIPGTIITVMIKGILAGLFAGLVYRAVAHVNPYLAVILSAIVCPVVNTGIFIGGSFLFFMDAVNAGAAAKNMSIGAYIIIVFVGLNFVFELLTNLVLCPAITRVLNIEKKKK